MALSKTWNNTAYSIPQSGERGWASLTNFLAALADGAQSTGKQFIGRRVATTSPVTVTATTDCYVGVNVSGAVATVNLPAGVSGQTFVIADESNAAATYNVTINPNGANTINGTTSYVLNSNKQVVGLVFSGTDWKLFAQFNSTSLTPSSSSVLTNKKLVDNSCTFVDDGDNTKQIAFQASGITTATTRTITVPDANVNLGGLTDSNIAAAAAVAITKIAAGAANQIIGANSGATANEYKTVSVGTTAVANDVGISNAANSLVIQVPTATTTVRGVASTAAQSFGGLKKFEGGLINAANVAANDSGVTFDNTSLRYQVCTPTANRTYTLPTTSIISGEVFCFVNKATAFTITLNSSGGNAIVTVPPLGYVTVVALQATPTTAAHWFALATPANLVKGETLGTSPVAGYIGEQISSTVGSTNAGTSGQYKDLTSISLTAGVWDITFFGVAQLNGATQTTAFLGISTTSGNSSSGLSAGDSSGGMLPPTSATDNSLTIGALRKVISSTTVYYAKIFASYSAGTPQFAGTLKATRVG